MLKNIKKTKKKIRLNCKVIKIDYEVFLLVRDHNDHLMNHIAALVKYTQIYAKYIKYT